MKKRVGEQILMFLFVFQSCAACVVKNFCLFKLTSRKEYKALFLKIIINNFFTQAIIRAVIGHGIEPEDQKHTWMEDAEAVSISSNRFVLRH